MATRRSTRLKSKTEQDADSLPHESSAMAAPELYDDVSNQSEHGIDDGDARPRRKKQKKAPTTKAARATTKRRDQLRMLAEMPVDVLLEVFSHLHPVDVLHLTWTSKDLRKLLMRRSALSVWRGAFDSVPGIPECPADQTLPQWARLLFVPHCHFCLTPNITTIMFTLRMRACQRCVSSRRDIFATFQELSRAMFLSPQLSTKVSANNFPCKWDRYKWGGGGWTAAWKRKDYAYLRADMEMTLASCDEALKNGTDALRTFLDNKVAEIAVLKQHMPSWEQWHRLERAYRVNELSDIRAQRRNDIICKLKELGYDADVNYITTHSLRWQFDEHALVRKNQILTEKVWSNIQQAVIDFVLEYRPARLAHERKNRMAERGALLKKALADYRASLPSGTEIPPDGDIAASSLFCCVWDVPLDVEMEAAAFAPSLAAIPALYTSWSQAVDGELMRCLGAPADADPAVLARATTWFFCGGCKMALVRRQVAEHGCFTCPAYIWSAREQREPQFFTALGSVPWNSKDAKGRVCMPVGYAQGTARPCAEALVRMCGMDPAQATAADMDAADVMFTCTRYGPEVAASLKLNAGCGESMSWSDAVRHHYLRHGHDEKGPSFELVREL